jgi:hypothetical protein
MISTTADTCVHDTTFTAITSRIGDFFLVNPEVLGEDEVEEGIPHGVEARNA